MSTVIEISEKLGKVFTESQANLLAEIIFDVYDDLVKTGDFNELKGIVRDFGIMVEGRLKREYVKDNKGGKIEVKIIGEAIKNGKKVMVIGEGKSQLSKNNVDEFIRKKLKRLEGVFEQIFPVLITYMISEDDVEEYAKEKGIALYYSYDF